jgi:hypothetical protein
MAAMAQKVPDAAKSTITIDGAVDPKQIPDWILWREFFVLATELAAASPTQGREFWVDRLHLSNEQMQHVILHSTAFRDEETRLDNSAKKHAKPILPISLPLYI